MKARLNRGDIHWRVEDHALVKLQSSMTSQLPHEFFTPLAGILGLTEVLGNDFASFSTAELQELIKDIHQSAQRLHRTLNNYLLILQPATELDEKKPPAVPSPGKEIEKVTQGVDQAAERNGRREDVTVQCACGSLRVSGSALAMITEDLVDNAPALAARTPVTVHLTEEGTLVVSDSGRGMTAKEIEQIGAFRQSDRENMSNRGWALAFAWSKNCGTKWGHLVIEQRPEKALRAGAIPAREVNGGGASFTCLPRRGRRSMSIHALVAKWQTR